MLIVSTLIIALVPIYTSHASSPSSSESGKSTELPSSSTRPSSFNVPITPPPNDLDPDLVDSIWNARHAPGLFGPRHRSISDRQYYQRRHHLGMRRKEVLSQNDHIHSLPEDLQGTSTHQRNTIRKRVLGLGFNDRMPSQYKGLRTSVYLEAEKMMNRDQEMDVHDAIKLAYAREHIRLGLGVDNILETPDLQASLPTSTQKGRRSAQRRARRKEAEVAKQQSINDSLIREEQGQTGVMKGTRSPRVKGEVGPSWTQPSLEQASSSSNIESERRQLHATLDLNGSPISSP